VTPLCKSGLEPGPGFGQEGQRVQIPAKENEPGTAAGSWKLFVPSFGRGGKLGCDEQPGPRLSSY
jgi:hypothetical protein